MSQLDLDLQLDPMAGAVRCRGGWLGYRDSWGELCEWRHPMYPDVVIKHCGHPTALRPFYIQGPNGSVAYPGVFSRLSEIQAYVLTHY